MALPRDIQEGQEDLEGLEDLALEGHPQEDLALAAHPQEGQVLEVPLRGIKQEDSVARRQAHLQAKDMVGSIMPGSIMPGSITAVQMEDNIKTEISKEADKTTSTEDIAIRRTITTEDQAAVCRAFLVEVSVVH